MSSALWFPTLGLLAWLCCLSLESVQGGKILVLPVDGSHWLSMKILVKELSRRGHDVLVVVPECSLLMKGSDSYKTEIYKVPYTKDDLDKSINALKDGAFLKPPSITDLFVNVERLVNFTSMQVKGCESLLNNHPLMTRLREEGFDLMLTDPFLPCGSVLAHMFSIPTVHFLRGLPCELERRANQCPAPPSYVPVAFSAHPKAKAFMTHGGIYGVYEGICNAVPMLMFPLFGDQGDNVHRMVSRGVAEKLNMYDVTAEKVVTALNKIIHDKSYKEKIMEMYAIHLDRPVEPLDLAVFWTEFIIKHKGAKHLRIAAHELNWIQYHSLDVIGFLVIILLTVLFVTFKCCLFCTRKCFRKGTVKKKKE
ncbi:UDP-glucuronosyltransferase [Collichthys lucidus]|uniref:UDP-glucuronosyltransferase n=1 Tax=Collichthys lucidus TaxID=240159 RepID=A0A4U5U0Z5_COLLU|nr:UDP-glucuronosyltransferase [Collichthys lucidus]